MQEIKSALNQYFDLESNSRMEAANQFVSIKARLDWFGAVSQQFSQLGWIYGPAKDKHRKPDKPLNAFGVWSSSRGQALPAKVMRLSTLPPNHSHPLKPGSSLPFNSVLSLEFLANPFFFFFFPNTVCWRKERVSLKRHHT